MTKQEFELHRNEIVASFLILDYLADLSANYKGPYETKGYYAGCMIQEVKNPFVWKSKTVERDYYKIDDAEWFVMLDGNPDNWKERDLIAIYNDLLQICEWDKCFKQFIPNLKFLLKLHNLI